MKQTEPAIFLHRISFSETSLITTFYTEKRGLQRFLFQGGKKKSAFLYPLALCEICHYKRPESELGKISSVDLVSPFVELRNHPVRSTIAFFMADVIQQSLKSESADVNSFQFLVNKIQELNSSSELSNFPVLFLVEFTIPLGINPLFSSDNPKYFNLIEGEFTTEFISGELAIEGSNVALLRDLFFGSGNTHNSSQRKELLEILLHYYRIHIPGFEIDRSLRIIQEVLYA